MLQIFFSGPHKWHSYSGDNTKKIWTHRFLAKPKRIAAGDLEGTVRPHGVQGDALLKEWVGTPLTILFFVPIKHAKTVIIRVNIG